MSRENVEVVRRAHEALSRHDEATFVREFHPEVEGVSRVMEAAGVRYRGHSGMRQFMEELLAVFPDFRSNVVRATDHGDVVIAELRMEGRAAASGIELEARAWQAIKFRDGKAIWFHGYSTEAEALEAAGLRV